MRKAWFWVGDDSEVIGLVGLPARGKDARGQKGKGERWSDVRPSGIFTELDDHGF